MKMHSLKRRSNAAIRSHNSSGSGSLPLNHVTNCLSIHLSLSLYTPDILSSRFTKLQNDHTFLDTSVQVPTPSAMSVMEELTTDTNDVPRFNLM
jgi:hypothetical protein